MADYKQAAKIGLLFINVPNIAGSLTVTDVMNTFTTQSGLERLDQYVVKLEQEFKNSGGKSFIVKRTRKDKISKLRFEIAKDILEDLQDTLEHKEDLVTLKTQEQKLLAIKAKKQDAVLEELTEDEIDKQLKVIAKAKRY